MTEAERAAHYEAHKDDPGLWGDPVPAPPHEGPRHLRARIAVTLEHEERERLAALSRLYGKNYPDLIRDAVRRYLWDTHIVYHTHPRREDARRWKSRPRSSP